MLRSSIRRTKLSSVISGTSSSADSRHSHASSVSSRAQEPQGHGSLRPLQRGRVDDLAGPLLLWMLTGIPAIDLSANAAFGVALIRADVISLALYLRGMHAGCNHPRPRPLTRLASSSHSTMMNPSSVTRNGESRRHQVTKPHCGTHHIIEGNVGCVRRRSHIRLPYCQHIIGKPPLL